ncbi:Alpha/Beta hydrolase protein [Panaeolus papilionaceus]|nr:Alpha/Beta hydrolase protein [Panaeolus papilionaceus]
MSLPLDMTGQMYDLSCGRNKQVTPTKDLRWALCFDSFQCARLTVPLDHHNPNGQQAALALIRKPSPLGPDHPDYRGPILFNPGGPGGSGVDFVMDIADPFARILGPQFDLVGFDPRGVGASTPVVSFYRSSFERFNWESTLEPIRDYNVARQWARAKVISSIARDSDDGALRYINTDQTARDMLSIVRAHGREKLQYWGFSYGTALGATFAAMFPDNVERLVLDGVVDVDDYYTRLKVPAAMWEKNLIDADKTLGAFVSGCHEAGPVGCHFWAPTITAVRHNMTKLFDNVRRQPISVTGQAGLQGVVDIDILEVATFMSLYAPYSRFPTLAEGYAALAAGDGSIILSMVGGPVPLTCPSEPEIGSYDEASLAIRCNGGDEIPADLESTRKYARMMEKLYPSWSPIWNIIRMGCTCKAGPFNATTSHPLLFVGNTADPVTPIVGAKKTSAGFIDSVVLTQDSAGHSSPSAPSVCTQLHIRRYFIDGTLPQPGTICSPDTPIFAGQRVAQNDIMQKTFHSLSTEEQDIYAAIQELSQKDVFIGRPPMFRGHF